MVLTKNPKTNRWQRWGGGYYLELESMIPNSVTEEANSENVFWKNKKPQNPASYLNNYKDGGLKNVVIVHKVVS